MMSGPNPGLAPTRRADEGAAPGLDLVGRRPLLGDAPEILFRLAPGDRPLVAPGEAVVAGATIAERLRDTSVIDLGSAAAPDRARPGDRWAVADRPPARVIGRPVGRLRGTADAESGELLFEVDGRWAVATGEHPEPVECPVTGVVRDVRPGVGIRVRAQGRALFGVEALGDPSSGRLSLGTDRADQRHGRLRATSLDVALAGTILVIGARVDAEALTRARAMGVRGVIVSGLAGKERRDFLASEGRQRAALHRLPPFGVLVLDGAVRRPIAGPIAGVFEALAGTTVSITIDPPALVFDQPELTIPALPDGHVRVRAGEHAGAEGRWAGPAGVRRFAGGTDLEAGWVVLDGDAPIPIPIADLERYG
jgi:hypothetical protein